MFMSCSSSVLGEAFLLEFRRGSYGTLSWRRRATAPAMLDLSLRRGLRLGLCRRRRRHHQLGHPALVMLRLLRTNPEI